MKRQRTFYYGEFKVIDWLSAAVNAFSVRKAVITRKPIPYGYKWKVVVDFD